MSPVEHALRCLVDGDIEVASPFTWDMRVLTHDETLEVVQIHLREWSWKGLPLEGVLDRAQWLHGRGSYVVPVEEPWTPAWRVGPGGRVREVH